MAIENDNAQLLLQFFMNNPDPKFQEIQDRFSNEDIANVIAKASAVINNAFGEEKTNELLKTLCKNDNTPAIPTDGIESIIFESDELRDIYSQNPNLAYAMAFDQIYKHIFDNPQEISQWISRLTGSRDALDSYIASNETLKKHYDKSHDGAFARVILSIKCAIDQNPGDAITILTRFGFSNPPGGNGFPALKPNVEKEEEQAGLGI